MHVRRPGALCALVTATALVTTAAAPAGAVPALAGHAPAVAAPASLAPTVVLPSVPDDDGAPYPRSAPLTVPAADPADASIGRGAIAYHAIAPVLNALAAQSDLVSTEVVGESTEGREIYLVTVTAPETAAESAQQDAWRDAIKHDAAAAAADPALLEGYKAPVWFNGNIHGNEWEGADATLAYITALLTGVEAGDEEATRLVENHRLYFTVTNNPDGRVRGTRATALNLDPNRDFITNTTPETALVRDLTGDLQPVFFVDLHGYTDILQVEPTGPPQGENYDHDLLMPHAYAAALYIEDQVVDADVEGNPLTDAGGILIPYRDTPSGWDGWPPIFTAQYVQFQGAISYTVELPLGRDVRGVDPADVPAENARRTLVNTTVGAEVINSTLEYVDTNRDEILRNQIEIFRRGAAGEPLVEIPANPDAADYPGPDEWAAEWDVADVTGTDFPRAYVIPAGEAQESETDVATLVEMLLAHGVEVGVADAAFTAGGTEYAAGSYVVDMHQPLRGLANVLLADGTDISDRVPEMYDISAWSLGLLWGAQVDAVGSTEDPALGVATTLVEAPAPTGTVPDHGGYLALNAAGVAEVQALNEMLDRGVIVSAVGDARYVVGPDDAELAGEVALAHGVRLDAAHEAELTGPDVEGVADLTVGYTSSAAYAGEDYLTLTELGFDEPVRVTAAGLADGSVDLDDVDVLWLGAPLQFEAGQEAGQAEVQAYLDAGKGFVGRDAAGAALATDFDLFDVGVVSGPRSANGIVSVTTVEDGVLAATASGEAFVYRPAFFTELGDDVTVEQAYTENPLISGHWVSADDAAGPADAAGQPVAVSAVTDAGSQAFLFGTYPTFRTHPRGMFTDLAAALFWAGPAGPAVEVPEEPTEQPTEVPTEQPTEVPTPAPSEPTAEPTVVPTAPTAPGGGQLPNTGVDGAALSLLAALALLGAGTLAALTGRRRAVRVR
ncbi:M14 family zinc carboxypeptidase [Georgenia faecalis]|uniref:M14 family zinc carboxypeptidase n=1 Tax=Georgenia faecalis TaxID=2483799 RepID=A0ABV9DA84_9MICO|nr:M14 family zinc carboxypeptidase [Georgenia faecalis]